MVIVPPSGMASRAFTTRFIDYLFDLTGIGFDLAEGRVEGFFQFHVRADEPA